MIYKNCEAYNPIYEERKEIIGSASGEPIYSEKEVLIDEYCSLYNSNNFNCETCPMYKTHLKQNVRQK